MFHKRKHKRHGAMMGLELAAVVAAVILAKRNMAHKDADEDYT